MNQIDTKQLASAMRAKRMTDGLSLRDVSQQLREVSTSTLSRIENGGLPDLNTYIELCRWLEVHACFFVVDPYEQTSAPFVGSYEDSITDAIAKDVNLKEDSKQALTTIVKRVYLYDRRSKK